MALLEVRIKELQNERFKERIEAERHNRLLECSAVK
jgi:hypothetical protein